MVDGARIGRVYFIERTERPKSSLALGQAIQGLTASPFLTRLLMAASSTLCFEALPVETLFHILAHVGAKELGRLAQSSSHVREVAGASWFSSPPRTPIYFLLCSFCYLKLFFFFFFLQ